MAESAGSIRAEVRLALDSLKKDVAKVNSNLGKISKGAASTSKKSGNSFLKLGTLIKGAAVFGAVALLRKGFSLLVSATTKQIKVEQQLAARLKSTGEAAGLNFEQLTKMAAGLQKVTTFGDETIIEAENLLLTFTKIGKDVFPNALETVLDMSTAFGQDLKQSSIQLGKALQDPVLGVTALRRVGVQLSDQQVQQIKDFTAMNDIASAQKIILGELETQVGGAARAAKAGVGGFTSLANAIGDKLEDAGRGVLTTLGNFAGVIADAISPEEDLDDITKKLVKTMDDYSKVIKELEENQDNLNKRQLEDLELKGRALEVQLFRQIDQLNKGYERQNEVIEQASLSSLRSAEALETLREKLLSTKEGSIELTEEEGKLLGITQQVTLAIDSLGNSYEETEDIVVDVGQALIDLSKAKASATNESVRLGKEEKELKTAIDNVAGGLIGQANAAFFLEGVEEGLKQAILDRIPVLKEELRLAAEKEENNKKVAELGEAQKKLLDELKLKEEELGLTSQKLDELKIKRELQKALTIVEGNQKATEAVEAYFRALNNQNEYDENERLEQKLADKREELSKAAAEKEKQRARDRRQLIQLSTDAALNIFSDFYNTQANMAEEGSEREKSLKRKAFNVDKIARGKTLLMSGIQSAQQAFNLASSVIPPPVGQIVGGVLSGLILAGTFVGIGRIASTDPGFGFGGIVPGSRGQGTDSVTSRLTPKEMVLNDDQQRQLFDIANGQNQTGGDTIIQIVAESGEKLDEIVAKRTENGQMKYHVNGLINLNEA